MPFINGRYYVNPIMGEALEAAREAESALAALETDARQNSGGADGSAASEYGDGFGDEPGGRGNDGGEGPIHRVEIEAAELVPSHSGRAAHGYVARVHRSSVGGAPSAKSAAPDPSYARGASNGGSAGRGGANMSGQAETHVFADHRDLLSFLRDELAKDHSRSKRSS